jgi:hypothetical protein
MSFEYPDRATGRRTGAGAWPAAQAKLRLAVLSSDVALPAISILTLIVWTVGPLSSYPLSGLVDLMLLTGAGVLVARIVQSRRTAER